MFWPFKTKKEELNKVPSWYEDWQELKANYPLGCTFEYLGRTMIVVKHREYRPGGDIMPLILPALICEYADNLGVIHQWSAPLGTWESFGGIKCTP